jgi:hypothetical protein
LELDLDAVRLFIDGDCFDGDDEDVEELDPAPTTGPIPFNSLLNDFFKSRLGLFCSS